MQKHSVVILLLLGAMASVRAAQTGATFPEGGHQVAAVVGQVVEQYLAGCHLVLAATTQHSPLLQHIIRQLPDEMSSVLVEAESLFIEEEPAQEHLLQGLWGEAGHTCRAIILHLTNHTLAFRFFERSELWLWPETRVVILGGRPHMEPFLHHPSLHNVKHFLYFAVHHHKQLPSNTKLKRGTTRTGWSEKVQVYRRCLYRNEGEVDIQFLRQWNLTTGQLHTDNLFLSQPEDFMGHRFQILARPFFPISNFRRNSKELGTTYTPLDSVDIRMMNSFAAHHNFTYVVREPPDGLWGMDPGTGNWTGIVGSLQHQQADFGFDLNLTPTRLRVLDFSIPYVRERIVIYSLKAGFMPQHLAIVRPFTGMIWLTLFISFLVWSVTLWLLQNVWSLIADGPEMRLSSALLYSWSSLMERWTFNPPINFTCRVLVGLWLLACEILTNTYRSSLVSHLIVQDKMPGINTFQDVVDRDGWGWGTSFSSGALMLFFKYHPHPVIQKIYEGMQHASAEEHFQRVLKGSYSHITYKNFGQAIVVAKFTDSRGYTPLHLSKTEYLQFLGIGWGFRRGAPFRHRISRMMQCLIEGGLIEYWLEDILSNHMREAEEEREIDKEKGKTEDAVYEVEDDNVILGLDHLQGAFYLLLLGSSLAALILLGENLAKYSSLPSIHLF